MNNSSADPEKRQPTGPTSFAEPIATSASVPIPPDSAEKRPAAPSVMEQTLQSRVLVLATLFGVTGALGLPLLWISPAFSRIQKILWTLLVLLYTSALIGGTWAILVWAYRQLR